MLRKKLETFETYRYHTSVVMYEVLKQKWCNYSQDKFAVFIP